VSAPRRDLTRAELAQLVRALAGHLDWIGWGDSYERGCAECGTGNDAIGPGHSTWCRRYRAEAP
jgi:hypothetical protein